MAARDVARARAFAERARSPDVHASLRRAARRSRHRRGLVPLPNNLHAEWSIRAANAGKHVLCEKPLAATAQEARSIFEAARRNNVYVVEGYPYRAQPQTIKMRELLAAGTIGRVQYIHAAFGFPLDRRRQHPHGPRAGGRRADGRRQLSREPGAHGRRRKGRGECTPWRAGRTAASTARWSARSSTRAASWRRSRAASRPRAIGERFIVGDAGSIETAYYNDTSAQLPPHLHVKRGTGWDAKQETIETAATGGFFAEAEAFHDLVAHGWSRWVGATPRGVDRHRADARGARDERSQRLRSTWRSRRLARLALEHHGHRPLGAARLAGDRRRRQLRLARLDHEVVLQRIPRTLRRPPPARARSRAARTCRSAPASRRTARPSPGSDRRSNTPARTASCSPACRSGSEYAPAAGCAGLARAAGRPTGPLIGIG